MPEKRQRRSDELADQKKRVHGTVHEVVAKRFEREKPDLHALPPLPFDTSWWLTRKVYMDCTLRFVVPHRLVGKQLTSWVKDSHMRIFDNNQLIVSYTVPEAKGSLVQDKLFYAALKRDKDITQRKYRTGRRPKARAKHTISPIKPHYHMDVQVRPLGMYDDFAAMDARP